MKYYYIVISRIFELWIFVVFVWFSCLEVLLYCGLYFYGISMMGVGNGLLKWFDEFDDFNFLGIIMRFKMMDYGGL